jgi:purine-binding chemotaxis protein CheW
MYLGVEVCRVQEIIRYQAMTRVPLAPHAVLGLINLRGEIVTAIDLRRRLELPDRDADAMPMNVVIDADDGAVSLLVDRIGDVIEVSEDAFERQPEMLSGVARELISGTYKLPERLLLVLDIDKTVDVAEPAR